MLIEVKQAVAADFQQINLHMLIYCNYLMRLKKLEKIMGMITDGHAYIYMQRWGKIIKDFQVLMKPK